jgi:Gamma tubulin complex component N-terminal
MFPALIEIMDEIEEQGLKGGQLLDVVAQKCVSGNPVIKSMFTKILFYCNRVLYQ